MQQRKILFLALTVFSSTGGIEKFNRALIKAMVDLQSILPARFFFAGMYDTRSDAAYTAPALFRAYSGKRARFVLENLLQSLRMDELIIGHLHLAAIGVLYKFFRPSKKLTVICHGIEVFTPVKGLKKRVLQKADHILAVSSFTKNKLVDVQGLSAEKISVFPNTIDPYFQLPADFSKPVFLQKRYGIGEQEQVIFTLTRLNSQEGYKGYDTIISILPELLKEGFSFKYILAGKADEAEGNRMKELISKLKLEGHVLMPGFIADEEVTAHYLLADAFVMPSKGEGFGIVYLEAMACGLPVIAGNKDGSTEALQFGELGTLVDPDSKDELMEALVNVLGEHNDPWEVQQKMLKHFSFEKFKERLQMVIERL